MEPLSFSLPTLATARNLAMIAIEPLSKYLNGCCGALFLRRLSISLAAYFAPWIATWATPGRLSREIMSPRTKTSGWPGRVRSRSEEHTSELQSLMRISYAVFSLKKKKKEHKHKI